MYGLIVPISNYPKEIEFKKLKSKKSKKGKDSLLWLFEGLEMKLQIRVRMFNQPVSQQKDPLSGKLHQPVSTFPSIESQHNNRIKEWMSQMEFYPSLKGY